MKVTIEQVPAETVEEILVRCHDADAAWVKAVQHLSTGAAAPLTICGIAHGKTYRIRLEDVYYFEVVDGTSFLYGSRDVYTCKQKLYKFEALCGGTMLFRCSKSMILNADKISYIRPSLSGRFEAVLDNGEKVIVSRQYVSALKKILDA